MKEGIKHDQGKTRFSLLVPEFIKGMADVMTFGAEKYSAWNWEGIEDHSRVLDAHMRHMFAQWIGEDTDAQSGHDHLFHVACNAMMLWKLKQSNARDTLKIASESLGSTTNRDWFERAINTASITKAMFRSETESTVFNTENVKIKGDLVAVRWMGENKDEIEDVIPFDFSYYEDEPFFESDHFWGVGEWVIFNKQFASVPVFEIVSDEIFNEKLKHLFE